MADFENFCPALKDELGAGATWNKAPSGMPGIGSQGFNGSWADVGFDDEQLDFALVGRIVACEWVRNNSEKWLDWIPALCGPGTLLNGAMTSCVACRAGYFCPGNRQGDELCPVGHFCVVNSSEPQPCDRGRTSERGSSSEADCYCSRSSVWISNRCPLDVLGYTLFVCGECTYECWISYRCLPVVDFFLPAVILPICVVLILVFVVLWLVRRRSVKVYIYVYLYMYTCMYNVCTFMHKYCIHIFCSD